jgi:hypothetical protein
MTRASDNDDQADELTAYDCLHVWSAPGDFPWLPRFMQACLSCGAISHREPPDGWPEGL